MRRIFTISLLLTILSLQSLAGTIKGKITDKTTGEPLVGAVVMLDKTELGATTGLDGSYTISGVDPGKYMLIVKYPSYNNVTEQVTVVNGDAFVLNIRVGENSSELAEAKVKGKFERGSDNEARNREKNSDAQMNIMSARTIELLPDITIGNVLQRVSGVLMQRDNTGEGRYAIIRGMEKRYNSTLVNGVKIPSPDDKARYVPMDIFPAEIVERLEVIKSLTPNMEADAVGGVMNLVLKNAPDKFAISASAASGFNQTLLDRSYVKFDARQHQQQRPLSYKRFLLQCDAERLQQKHSHLSACDANTQHAVKLQYWQSIP